MSLNGWLQYARRHSDWEIVLVSQYEELLEQGRTFAHRTVFSPESRDGASWTIKNGLKEADDTEAFVFFTADQPWLREKTMEGFVCEMEQNSMQTWAVSVRVKRPVIRSGFHRKYLPDLQGTLWRSGREKDPEKASGERSRWYPVAHAKELEDVDYNFG